MARACEKHTGMYQRLLFSERCTVNMGMTDNYGQMHLYSKLTETGHPWAHPQRTSRVNKMQRKRKFICLVAWYIIKYEKQNWRVHILSWKQENTKKRANEVKPTTWQAMAACGYRHLQEQGSDVSDCIGLFFMFHRDSSSANDNNRAGDKQTESHIR